MELTYTQLVQYAAITRLSINRIVQKNLYLNAEKVNKNHGFMAMRSPSYLLQLETWEFTQNYDFGISYLLKTPYELR